MLMPSCASGPVRAPAIAMLSGGHVALPSPAGLTAALTSGGLISLPFASIGTCSTIFRVVCDAFPPGLDCVHPAIPMTSNPAAPRATALCVTRPRTCHLHVGVVVGASSIPRLSAPRVEHSQRVAAVRVVGQPASGWVVLLVA